MAKYEELLARIDNAYQKGTRLYIPACDIEYLSREEIQNLQQKINAYNINYINESEKKNVIDANTAEYLRNVCTNPSQIINNMVQKISYSILHEYRSGKIKKLEELGEEIAPDEINAIDLHSGKIEENPYSDGDNRHTNKEYQTKHITPFTSMRLTFYDFRDNPIYVIMPGMKDIRRAIDKVRLPVYDNNGKLISRGGKYYEQYLKDMQKVVSSFENKYAAKYKKGSAEYKKAMKAAEPEIQKEQAKVLLPFQRLKDIYRFTICRKYYQDTEETLQLFAQDPQYAVQKAEIKDAFHGNINESSAYETKNYRDKKVYLNLDGIKIEVQIKITKLHGGDVITSEIYAGVENNESRDDNVLLISQQNTKNKGLRFWEENKGRYIAEGDKKIVNMKILERQLAAQKVNKKNIREYNLQVLDKAFRLEDAKRANNKEFDEERVHPINKQKKNTYNMVANFIQDNFIYRPFKAFDMQQKFNVTDEELKSLGLVVTKAQLDDLFDRYADIILPRYNGRIEGNEAEQFANPKNQEKIKLQFAESAFNEQSFAEVKPSRAEIQMLQSLDKEPLDVQKYHKILANKNRYYHNRGNQKYRMMRTHSQER